MNTSPSQNKIIDAKEQLRIAKNSDEKCKALSNLGDAYFMDYNYEKAIFNYNKALEINPNLKITLFNLGKIYLNITEYQKAVEAFVKAIELDPENATALRYLAGAYCSQSNMLKSVETYKKCLKLRPDDLNTNFELAMVYYRNLKNLREAENYFKKCIQLDSQREEVYRNFYPLLIELNKRIDASNICMALGDIYFEKPDLESATVAFITALNLDPENADGHWKLGLTMHKLGHFDSAILRYKAANKLTPDFDHP